MENEQIGAAMPQDFTLKKDIQVTDSQGEVMVHVPGGWKCELLKSQTGCRYTFFPGGAKGISAQVKVLMPELIPEGKLEEQMKMDLSKGVNVILRAGCTIISADIKEDKEYLWINFYGRFTFVWPEELPRY